MYWFPQLRGHSFQKARNFIASSHQNAGFSIWVFKNFPGVIPPDPHSGRGRSPPAPNTQSGLWPGAGHKRPGVGTQTLVPFNFSAMVAPLYYCRCCCWCCCYCCCCCLLGLLSLLLLHGCEGEVKASKVGLEWALSRRNTVASTVYEVWEHSPSKFLKFNI